MINTPTVLILGAGASEPYQFPLGWGLMCDICNGLADDHNNLLRRMLTFTGRQADEIKAFAVTLNESSQSSVDAFLEKQSQFLDIGKEAITCALVPLERHERLFRLDNRQHWYRYLFKKMDAKSLEDFGNNKVSFITFNYDRSLEHFLFVSLKRSYGKTDAETAKALQRIPIVHVYGQLGKYPHIDKTGRDYVAKLGRDVIEKCVGEIALAHETTARRTFAEAHELLRKAEKVWFLGFGYYRLNVERLDLGSVLRKHAGIFGTAYGLEQAERNEIDALVGELSRGRRITLADKEDTCYMTLRKWPVLE